MIQVITGAAATDCRSWINANMFKSPGLPTRVCPRTYSTWHQQNKVCGCNLISNILFATKRRRCSQLSPSFCHACVEQKETHAARLPPSCVRGMMMWRSRNPRWSSGAGRRSRCSECYTAHISTTSVPLLDLLVPKTANRWGELWKEGKAEAWQLIRLAGFHWKRSKTQQRHKRCSFPHVSVLKKSVNMTQWMRNNGWICSSRFESPKVYEFAVKEVLIHRVPLVDGGISPQKKKRKHRHAITIDYSCNKSLFGNNLPLVIIFDIRPF